MRACSHDASERYDCKENQLMSVSANLFFQVWWHVFLSCQKIIVLNYHYQSCQN